MAPCHTPKPLPSKARSCFLFVSVSRLPLACPSTLLGGYSCATASPSFLSVCLQTLLGALGLLLRHALAFQSPVMAFLNVSSLPFACPQNASRPLLCHVNAINTFFCLFVVLNLPTFFSRISFPDGMLCATCIRPNNRDDHTTAWHDGHLCGCCRVCALTAPSWT